MNLSGWMESQGELEEALRALETSSGGIKRPGLLVLGRAAPGVTVARSEQAGGGRNALPGTGGWWRCHTGRAGHWDTSTAVVLRLTRNIHLTGGDWDSPREII